MENLNYKLELKKDYEHWQDVYENGCNDPSWADGFNLNLIRNHIIYYKVQLMETLAEDELPELYFKELPPKVDPDYIAKKEQILKNAKVYYNACIHAEGWNRLEDAFDFLDENDQEQKSMRFLVSRVTCLKKHIENEEYVAMRRYKDSTDMINKINKCAERLDELQIHGVEQLSLFQM